VELSPPDQFTVKPVVVIEEVITDVMATTAGGGGISFVETTKGIASVLPMLFIAVTRSVYDVLALRFKNVTVFSVNPLFISGVI